MPHLKHMGSQSTRFLGRRRNLNCPAKMQSITLVFAAMVACAYAQVSMPPGYEERYPQYYKYSRVARHPRDLTWERNAGPGKIFGTLGNTDDSLFGRGGYKQDIFNDHRGHLTGQAYGSRVLGANGDSSSFGGKLDWANNNAKLGADLHREIGGRGGLTVQGDGLWHPGKNTVISAGGHLDKTFGHNRPDIGVQAGIEHRF